MIEIAKNNRLKKKIAVGLAEVKAEYERLNDQTGFSGPSITVHRRAGVDSGV